MHRFRIAATSFAGLLSATALAGPPAAPPTTDPDGDAATVTEFWAGTTPVRVAAPGIATDPEERSESPAGPEGPIGVADQFSIEEAPDGDAPRDVAWTPDGTQLVVVNRDTDNLTIHDAATGAPQATIDVGDFPVSVAVTPDGTRAVVCNTLDDTISIVDLTSQTVLTTLPVTGAEPFDVQVTADGARAVVAVINDGVASQFSVFDLGTFAETVIPVGGMGAIGFAATIETGAFQNFYTHFALTDNDLAVCYDRANDTVWVADVVAGTATPIAVAEGPDSVDVTPDGTRAMVGCETANELAIIDLTTNTVENSFPQPGVNDRRVRITDDGSRGVFWADNFVSFVNLNNGVVYGLYDHGFFVNYDLELTASGAHTLVGSSQARLLNTFSGTFVQTLVGPVIYELEPSPVDERMVGLSPLNDTIVLYDADGASGSVLGTARAGEPAEGDNPFGVAIAPGGDLAVAGLLTSGNAAIVELPSGNVRSWIDCGERVKHVEISPDGRWAIVLAMDENEIVVIDLLDDSVAGTLTVFNRPGRVRFSPDSSEAYVLNIAGTDQVSFIELEPVPTIVAQVSAGQTGAANGPTWTELSGIELSADGSILAVCDSFNDLLRLYDTATRTEVAAVPTGDFPLNVTFSLDGTRAYVTNHFSDDLTVVDVDGSMSSVAGTVTGLDRFPIEVEVSPDGAFAYVATRASGGAGIDAVWIVDTATLTAVDFVFDFDGYPRTMQMTSDSILHVATTNGTVARVEATGIGSTIVEVIELASGPKSIDVDEASGRTVVVGPSFDLLNFIEGDVPPCPADLDGSGAVDFGDLLTILGDWGEVSDADLDASGTVDFGDLLIVLGAWGPCP